MSKQEMLKMQTWVLRVNIQCHCDGCKKKIRKLLQKIDGVYSTQVNAEQGRVTVTGNVDPATLIKKLEKSGKHAELWGPQKGSGNNNYHNLLNNFKNMQFDGSKGGGGGGGGGGNNNKSQKGGKGQQGQQQMQQFKGSKDLMMPNKMDQKSAKFNMHDQDDFGPSDGDFDDDFDDYDDELDDDFEDDEEEEFAYGHNGHHLPNKMMMPMEGKDGRGPHGPFGVVNGPGFSNKSKGGGGGGGGGGNGKKKGSGVIELPVVVKGKGGNNDGKNGSGGKKGKSGQGGDGKNNSSKGGKDKKKDGKDKNCGKSGGGVGGLLGFLKRSKSGREIISDGYDFVDNDIIVSGGKSNGNGTKKGGGKNEGSHDINKMKQGVHELDYNKGPRNVGQMGKMGQMDQMGKMGQMGQVGPMGNYGRMGNMPAVQGLPAQPVMNGGYYQGMGSGNPYNQQQYHQQQYNQQQYHQQQYNQQQQYMAMLMNQQRQNGSDMYQPYGQPHSAGNYNYMPQPPPMLPPPVADPFTHIFSDENTGSCRIM